MEINDTCNQNRYNPYKNKLTVGLGIYFLVGLCHYVRLIGRLSCPHGSLHIKDKKELTMYRIEYNQCKVT